jgi:hypothetical protein
MSFEREAPDDFRAMIESLRLTPLTYPNDPYLHESK